jgi:hypothetical protein
MLLALGVQVGRICNVLTKQGFEQGGVNKMATITGVKVELVGQDGNAFMIMGLATKAMRRGGVKPEVIDAYKKEAMSGDYDHLLQTTMNYCEVE